jgi:DNA-binding IclR family transcriptional regulator
VGPLNCTGVGKVLLAYALPQIVQACIAREGLPRSADNTIVDQAAFMLELKTIRETGFSVDREESGIRSVAAPIFGSAGNVIAAIGVSGSVDQMYAELGNSAQRQPVVETAAAISRAISSISVSIASTE